MREPIAFVLKGYPRLSETFIAEEILGLEQAGFDLRIVALRRPTDTKLHPVHRAIVAPVSYLPEYLHQEPLRVLKAWWSLRQRPGLAEAWRQFRADLPRDISRNRFRRIGQAMVLAADLPPDVTRLHAHFIHTPASVVDYASLILGRPWTCSAHAKDIWTSPDWELAGKLRRAIWTVTCTRAGLNRLQSLSPVGKAVHLVYHGLKLDRFRPLAPFRGQRDGLDQAQPVRLLSVGRAVEKKGFDTLLDALALLPRDCAWAWTHIGGGPLLPALKQQAERLGLSARLSFLGAQDQTVVLERYRASDLFILPCRVAQDGDRDGLPNVLVEAQSQSLVCISTDVGGVAELIEHDRNGLLVPPDQPEALADAIHRLIRDPSIRRRLGDAGGRRVAADFDARTSLSALAALFDGSAADTDATGLAPEPGMQPWSDGMIDETRLPPMNETASTVSRAASRP
ncbi:glycosyltransferase family 4 protein [Lichenihabitans psoromatis]|uniref:glycosyltransferase family 4 protein n=1 Tax=Lichenihabitans psoromatis TaxID=2528642 RepID=UPI00103847BF|nr:glycosyltransferase family 4 protein [Lichenihabitans psoromatis]